MCINFQIITNIFTYFSTHPSFGYFINRTHFYNCHHQKKKDEIRFFFFTFSLALLANCGFLC